MTQNTPMLAGDAVPRHVAIIMDGNGRWARQRLQPRAMGHRAGVRSARKIVRAAHKAGVKVLTVFAFSQENWRRPEEEVRLLMQLFIRTLSREINSLHKNGVRLRFIGDHRDFSAPLRQEMQRAETLTRDNAGLHLVVAVGYGGQGDIVQAVRQLQAKGLPVTEEHIEAHLHTAGLPLPDLMIRTGGEQRISNFLLWQLAYAELYFSDTLWPDFGEAEFLRALAWYAGRERRFGRVPESV
ncbi:MAG TPA: polyprenyl diphosphate synthase [Stenotrophobium sp.]|jgi:undecaprenyl diphosphate synthase|nr:polyprenyl diphosphate synthase [Stenotrophobium sp.]